MNRTWGIMARLRRMPAALRTMSVGKKTSSHCCERASAARKSWRVFMANQLLSVIGFKVVSRWFFSRSIWSDWSDKSDVSDWSDNGQQTTDNCILRLFAWRTGEGLPCIMNNRRDACASGLLDEPIQVLSGWSVFRLDSQYFRRDF